MIEGLKKPETKKAAEPVKAPSGGMGGGVPVTIVKVEKKESVVKCGRCRKEKGEGEGKCKCGRPSDYTPELVIKAWEYLDLKMPNAETEEDIHSIEGLAVYLDITREIIYIWIKDPLKEEFFDIYRKVMAKQGKTLIRGGLNQTFGQTITKLMLSKHGYRDSVENINVVVPVDPEAKAQADKAIDEYLNQKNK